MRCKICGFWEMDSNSPICEDCLVAIKSLDIIIGDLEDYLKTADSKRLPEFYSKNLHYFVSALSTYNRYVNLKNLIQEVIFSYLTIESNEKIMSNDLENNEPLRNPRIRQILASKEMADISYDASSSDLVLYPKDRIKISKFVFESFGINGDGFNDYLNSILLYSMIVLISDDITSWENGTERNFPGRGFYPWRLISGAVWRAVKDEKDSHFVTSDEIIYSIKRLSYKGRSKAISQVAGLEFQSKSIFLDLPDSDENTNTLLTAEFNEIVNHFAERIRERVNERER